MHQLDNKAIQLFIDPEFTKIQGFKLEKLRKAILVKMWVEC